MKEKTTRLSTAFTDQIIFKVHVVSCNQEIPCPSGKDYVAIRSSKINGSGHDADAMGNTSISSNAAKSFRCEEMISSSEEEDQELSFTRQIKYTRANIVVAVAQWLRASNIFRQIC